MSNNTSLAVKWRPQHFTDVVEQSITTELLSRILRKGTPKHAYLFSGDSGCGKTTIARIFANELNLGEGSPIEIDAASNNGVDQVRAIISEAKTRSITGKYKIFIIDEAHAITTAGWQAFLKGLEEPPAYSIFMFCTTEPNKIPVTILNRLQRYNITKISNEGIRARLIQICAAEGFINYEETCDLISKISNGCMRDAITLLDQCADFSTDLALNNTKLILGDVSAEVMLRLTNYVIDRREDCVLSTIETIYRTGQDLRQFVSKYLDFLIDLTKYALFNDINMTNIPAYLENSADTPINVRYTVNAGGDQTAVIGWLNAFVDHILSLKVLIKNDSSYKSTIEAYFIKACRG